MPLCLLSAVCMPGRLQHVKLGKGSGWEHRVDGDTGIAASSRQLARFVKNSCNESACKSARALPRMR